MTRAAGSRDPDDHPGRRRGLGRTGCHIWRPGLAHQYDHGCVVTSAGSVLRNTLLDCEPAPETIWLDVRPQNLFPVICAVMLGGLVVPVAFQTAVEPEFDKSLRI